MKTSVLLLTAILSATTFGLPPTEGECSLEAAKKWLEYLPKDEDVIKSYQKAKQLSLAIGKENPDLWPSKFSHDCPDDLNEAEIEIVHLQCESPGSSTAESLSGLTNIRFEYQINNGNCGVIKVYTTDGDKKWRPPYLSDTRKRLFSGGFGKYGDLILLEDAKLDFAEALQVAINKVPELNGEFEVVYLQNSERKDKLVYRIQALASDLEGDQRHYVDISAEDGKLLKHRTW